MADEVGTYFVDCTYTDDAGAKTYSNFKVQVIAVEYERSKLVRMYFLMGWAMTAFIIYLSYAWLFSIQLFSFQIKHKNQDRHMAELAAKRFKDFEDFQLAFVFPEFILGEVP